MIPILFALWTGTALPLHAQIATTTATISGTLTDPTGALLPKAAVTLTSSETGITRSFTTDNTGRYSFSQLPPSTYTLSVKAKGFKAYAQTGIVLNAAQAAPVTSQATVTPTRAVRAAMHALMGRCGQMGLNPGGNDSSSIP